MGARAFETGALPSFQPSERPATLRPQMHSVEITGITHSGEGVGRLPDGRVTFVHRTAVGDRVEVRITEEKPRWTRSELHRLLEPGPARREAPCPHYPSCGGCTVQHLDYEAQLDAKADVATDALQRIGGLDLTVPPVDPSPTEFRYRNRVTFTLRRRSGGVVAGFRAVGHPDRIVDVSAACLLPEQAIADVWGELRSAWGPSARRLPSGEELRLTLRSSREGAVALAVDGGYAPGRPRELVEAVPGLIAVWHRPAKRSAHRLLAGDEALRDVWADEELELSGDVFTQVNRDAAERLERWVMDRVMAGHPERVLDAYCGVGLYTRRLERAGVAVTAIEAHPGAVVEARRAAPGSTILQGTVEARLPEALAIEAAILNPPRAGLARVVVDRLAGQGPVHILYVSCDPATLARDLKGLVGSYRVAGVRCFDLFPQTAHVETVVELERCGIS